MIAESDCIGGDNYIPQGLLFQWHITEKCNLRCAHCYQESYQEKDLSFQELRNILNQYIDLLSTWRKKSARHVGGHITVTGGEPFIREDFLNLLELFHHNKKNFTFAILTNGTFIDKKMAHYLKNLSPAFIQLSVEGTKSTHDNLRGAGSYDKTIDAIKNLVKNKIKTYISFTAHRGNYKEFTDVADLAYRLRASRLWSDRLIPCGSGLSLKDQLLSPHQTKEYVELMRKTRIKYHKKMFNHTEIAMHRALQFHAGGEPYHCTAGDSLITVLQNGDLYPCARMPVKTGNLLKKNLRELYYDNDLFKRLRNKDFLCKGCENCWYEKLCRGGLKCLSYAVQGDPFIADPGCWHSSSNK